MIRYLVIGLAIYAIWWLFNSRSKLPRRPERIGEDFRLAKNRWATGTWAKDEAAAFLDRLHRDALDGSRRSGDSRLKQESNALANEIMAWTLDNLR